jgi:PAS domain S-box-containing protein
MTQPSARDGRVLVLMPTLRDGERTLAALATAGLTGTVCPDLAALCREVSLGAGVALLTEEELERDQGGALREALRGQPAWSDLPLVLVARPGSAGRPEAWRESMNLSLIERPVRMRSLVSIVRAALRSRQHQYALRDLLAEREHQAGVLRDQEERLQFALTAGRLGAWDLDLASGQMSCSALCKEIFGWPLDQELSYQALLELVHPGDRDRVRAALGQAIAARGGCDLEYRTLWPDGSIRWVLLRGRARAEAGGRELRMSGVALDMTDRRRAEDGLRDADRQKDDFLALLAHELRNPLAPLRNGLQLLRRAEQRASRDRTQEMMERQLGHMVRLIDDLLDVSRINRNKMELRLSRVLLAEAVASAVETARPLIESSRHQLELELPAEPVELDADLTRLVQVFANLLTNSAKYTDPGGRIRLSAARDGDQVVVTVRDTGIGIPREALGSVFDMFSQVDRSLERVTGGLGIGLALVRKLVEMHGGTVVASSDGPGRGSIFTVRLPAVAAGRAQGADGAGRASQLGPGLRILIVDDNRDSAQSMADMLRVFGNEVAVAHDGAEGVERAGAFRPGLILMDIGMPRLNGLDATRQIREQPWGREISIVALTGWGQEADRVRSREAGCDGHLVKPASLEDLSQLMAGLKRATAPI